MRDPYEVLGVKKDAETTAIKQAYRKLARELHPDLHPGDSKAEERFKEVAAAYDFLSDADKKARYDRGEIDSSGAPKAERRFYRDYADAGRGARYSDPGEYFRDAEGMDFFSELFRGARRDARSMRGADMPHQVEVDFLDAVNGAQRELALSDGRRLKVSIPPGTESGQVLRLKGQGMPGPAGGPSGDLLLAVMVRPHPKFTRVGNDIHADLAVTVQEAMLGAKVDVPTVDGRVTLTIPKHANTGMQLRVRGKGVRTGRGDARGDQYVTLKVMLPEAPSAEVMSLVEEWGQKHGYSVRER